MFSGAVWSLRTPLGAGWATELFSRALASDPAPTNFEAVANLMNKTAKEEETGAIHSEFFDRRVIGPQRPTELVAMCGTSGNIVLTWTDEASSEAGYEVMRQTDGGTRQLVVRLGSYVETYSDTGASCGGSSQTRYSYHVTVFSTFGSANTDTDGVRASHISRKPEPESTPSVKSGRTGSAPYR